MASTASSLIKFEKMATGEKSGTWGTLANQAMSRLEEKVAGYRAITLAGSTYVLDDTQYVVNAGTTAESHLGIIKATGTPGASRQITIPLRTQQWLMWNAVTTYDMTIAGASGAAVTISNGYMAHVFTDGTNVEFSTPLTTPAGVIAPASMPAATAAAQGAVELATDAEAITGSATGLAITPANLTASLNKVAWCGTMTGSADAGALAPTPAITAYVAGQRFVWKASSSVNTGAMTVAISGLSTIAVQSGLAALTAGAHAANAIYMGILDTTSTIQIVSISNWGGLEARLALESAGTVVMSDGSDAVFAGVHKQGKHTIFIPAAAMRPTKSNGCASITDVETTAGKPDLQVLDFDASADEHAQFQIAMPKSWNESTVTAQFYWTSTATDTDGVTWGIQGVAVSDNESIDASYGTPQVIDDLNQGAVEELLVSSETPAITLAGTPAVGDMCFFRVFRDVSDSNDTAAEDARLLGAKMFFTTNAADDT